MSPDLEIMIAASILEKSGFRLIFLWCNTTEPIVTCIIKYVVLFQNDIDIGDSVTRAWLKLLKNLNVLKLSFEWI